MIAYPPPVPPPATTSHTCDAGAHASALDVSALDAFPLDRAPTPDGTRSCATGNEGGRVYGHLG